MLKHFQAGDELWSSFSNVLSSQISKLPSQANIKVHQSSENLGAFHTSQVFIGLHACLSSLFSHIVRQISSKKIVLVILLELMIKLAHYLMFNTGILFKSNKELLLEFPPFSQK